MGVRKKEAQDPRKETKIGAGDMGVKSNLHPSPLSSPLFPFILTPLFVFRMAHCTAKREANHKLSRRFLGWLRRSRSERNPFPFLSLENMGHGPIKTGGREKVLWMDFLIAPEDVGSRCTIQNGDNQRRRLKWILRTSYVHPDFKLLFWSKIRIRILCDLHDLLVL